MSELLAANLGILLGAAILLLGGIGLLAIARLRTTTKDQRTIELLDALVPWAYKAVIAGEQAALWGLQEADTLIQSTDRKKVADAVYALLPEVVTVGQRVLPVAIVKSTVSQERFEELIKQVYDSTHSLILSNEAYLRHQVETLKAPHH